MYLYPFWVRLWHLLNAIFILVLIYSGISIFFQEKSASFFIMEYVRAEGWHDVFSKLLIISYVGYLAGNIFTDNGKYYRISRGKAFRNFILQLRYTTVGMFRHEKKPFPITPERKFNPLQKLSYVVIMYIAFPLIIISGIVLMITGLPAEAENGAGPAVISDLVHIILGIVITLFLFVHIYMAATLGSTPSSGLRSIISGYAESEEE